MAVGLEDFNTRLQSRIVFWDLAGASAQLPSIAIDRSGQERVSTAGAVGVSSYGRGAALAVAT
jgi:hypothetical protein